MEVSKIVRRGDEGTYVDEDAGSWSDLEPGICDMILDKLPCRERARLRVVCKDWNRSALKRVERKPYFVTIPKGTAYRFPYLSELIVYDVVSKSLSFEPLPPIESVYFPYDGYRFEPLAMEGLILSNQPKGSGFLHRIRKQWCVYNIHTRSKHVLPEAPGSGCTFTMYFCGMMADTSIKPYTFKLVVIYSSGEEMQIYDSTTRLWSSHPRSNPISNSSRWSVPYKYYNWYFCMCHKGCMYMCTEYAIDGVLVYSIEEDLWSKLSGSPFRGMRRTYLGAWDDRIFAVLHDAEAESVTVWELIDATLQGWVEYARCSETQYEHLIKCVYSMEDYKREIVSVFSEEYVLMYNWHECQPHALVLLNLKTREWERASMPNGSGVARPVCAEVQKTIHS